MLPTLQKIYGINEESVIAYAYLQILEKWLREMVYIELKSKKGRNWFNFHKTKKTYENDKKYNHMATTESNPLSYITFDELQNLVDNNWENFSVYLPPQDIWVAKLKEIIHIRNRVAHFRSLHKQDLNKIKQFLRDIDKGFWTFCVSYNSWHEPSDDDPVANNFIDLNPYSLTYRHDKQKEFTEPFIMSINIIKRLWQEPLAKTDGIVGYLYNISFTIKDNRHIDYKRFLSISKNLHNKFIHICLEQFSTNIRITIPSIYGAEELIKIITDLISHVRYAILPGTKLLDPDDKSIQYLSDSWPEYVLGPDNPLTFLGSDQECSFFNA